MSDKSISNDSSKGLSRYLSPLGAWALAFGCSVGWGCFVMPGTTFLPLAGPIGTTIGMFVGGIVMLIIGVNYHYMMNRYPDVGGTFTYTKKESGYDHGLLSTWFLFLVYIAIIWANATAIPLIFRNLSGEVFMYGLHYRVAGFDVYAGEIIITLIAIFVAALVCCIGGRIASFIQTAFAIILICGILFIAYNIFFVAKVPLSAIRPGFAPERSLPNQVLSIVVLAPWAYVGFESISHSVEEFRFPVKKTLKIMVSAIITAVVAYSLLAIIAVTKLPEGCTSWIEYIGNLDSYTGYEALPTFNAAFGYEGIIGAEILTLTTLSGIMTGLIGFTTAASRLIYAMSLDNLIPRRLSRLSKSHVPVNAIIFVAAISLPIPFFGRTAISWIVDISTIGAAIAYAYTSAETFKASKAENHFFTMITGAAGTAISLFFAIDFLIPNIWSDSAMASESYIILIAWSVLGFQFIKYAFIRDKEHRFGKSSVVWIVMLFLILFVSMIWFRESSKHTTEMVLDNLGGYNLRELSEHGVTSGAEEQLETQTYIGTQLNQVDDAMFRNSIIQMAIIMLSLFTMFDIYNRMQKTAKELEIEKAKAQESSRAKSMFLSNMSHDLRTPMNAIIGYTQIAKDVENMPPEGKEYLEKIDYSSMHLLALINDVLDMGRIESGKMELTLSRTDLMEMAHMILEIFESQMQQKHIEYKVEAVDIKDRYVMCDAPRLNRVLLNLISNACKFTSEGGKVTVTIRQTMSSEKKGSYRFIVKDTGMGMSPEFANKVFEIYTREDSAANIQGTGLGMAITKSIVDLMGGTIKLSTKQGEGTEFTVCLDFDIAPAIEERTLTGEAKNEDIDYSRYKLLVAEDQVVNREIARKILEKFGFHLEFAENGAKALSMVRESQPGYYTAVLMDVRMPEMDGYEATKAIRALEDKRLSSVPIIAMSANAFEDDVRASLEVGMNAHIAKPIQIDKLMSTLDRAILGQL